MRYSSSKALFNFTALFCLWLISFFLLTGGLNAQKFSHWTSAFFHWDSELYKAIWENGYLNSSQKVFAFPPAYSYLVGVLSKLLGSFHFTAIVVNLFSFFMSGFLYVKIISKQFQAPSVLLSLIFLSSLTNYFVFAAYSDSFFIFLVWLLIYLLVSRPKIKHGAFFESALFLILPWVRIVGVSLFGLVLNRVKNTWLILFSFALFLLHQFYFTQNAFSFLKVQQSMFAMPEGGFVTGFNYTFSNIFNFSDPWYLQAIVFPAFYFVAIATSCVWFWFKGHRNYALIMFGFLAMSHNMAFWRSTVRYDWFSMPLVFIPLIVGAKKSSQKWLYYLAIFGFLFIQFYFQIKFAKDFRKGLWAF